MSFYYEVVSFIWIHPLFLEPSIQKPFKIPTDSASQNELRSNKIGLSLETSIGVSLIRTPRTASEAQPGTGPVSLWLLLLKVSTSLGHPQVPVGLSVGNPQVIHRSEFWVAQVFADLGSTSVEAGTHHRYSPYLSLNLVLKNGIRFRDI